MLHPSTFEYLKPTDEQVAHMATVRQSFFTFAKVLDAALPDGPDKTYVMRKIREVSMWANTALTRNADGSPRTSA